MPCPVPKAPLVSLHSPLQTHSPPGRAASWHVPLSSDTSVSTCCVHKHPGLIYGMRGGQEANLKS